MKKLLALLIAGFALMAVSIPFTSAQDCPATGTPVTKTYTEAEINSSFRVTNPANRSITNEYVNLQPGQVTITATLTWRSSSGVRSDDVAVVLVPSLVNGRVYWNVLSITADSQPASAELVAQINASLATAWRRWLGENGPQGHITNVTVTEDDISYTYIPWDVSCAPPPVNLPSSVTYTETQINNSFRVTNPADRRITNEYVNLQPGQVTITGTLSWRQRGSGVQTANVAVVLTPTISNGRVEWNVVSITSNGQPASADLVTQINASLAASWRRWIAANAPSGVVTGVTITENDITFTFAS